MKILITGANGYIGSHVVKRLLDKGHEVAACDVRMENVDERARKLECDIFGEGVGTDIFRAVGSPDVCLHLAWRDGFVHNSDRHIADLSKHYTFLTSMVNGGLRHLAVMGTMHEVGYHEGSIDENTPCNPQSLYAVAKNTLRQALSLFLKDKECVFQWLRGFYIYGDDARNHSVFTKLLEADKAGKQEFPFTTGKNQYDFMSVNELAAQIAAVLLQEKVNGIINCCTGHPVSLAEMAERFIRENGLRIKLKYGAYPDRPYDSPCIYGDSAKIRQILQA
ncbi:MAG: NAD(P)-dependent oxidoreductase [Bacteroides sp.]|nr:NAD(P)-dependent oxidoreductase [Ruminococcus flavefaciens]MCM1554535.1 NAD(P)-dependent oxidoreductase [Bacteroides sp.]